MPGLELKPGGSWLPFACSYYQKLGKFSKAFNLDAYIIFFRSFFETLGI